MKVLLVGDFPPPHGGVAVHVELLYRAIRAAGGQCVVLDIGKGQLPADGVFPAGGLARFTALLASHAARGFQIHVHTSGANPKSWMLASICAAAGRIRGKPIITFHSGMGPDWINASAVRRRMAGAVARQFGTVIAVSDAIRECLRGCGVERLEVLPAFSSSFLTPGEPPRGFGELRAEAAPLYCAMLAPDKIYGREILLDAFAKVRAQAPASRLAVYGPGTGDISAPGVAAYGELQRPSALAVMAGADIFIRPTLADGDSVSVREALALGRIVVATSVGNRPPEVRLVPPGDAAALARALLEAAADVAAKPDRAAIHGADCVQRLLVLYGAASSRAADDIPEASRCAESAAS
jgi:glycosyltransferase involved in cell wall biosynthesis